MSRRGASACIWVAEANEIENRMESATLVWYDQSAMRRSPLTSHPLATGRRADLFVRALAAGPRLPATRHRRLLQLIKKSRESTLSVKEMAELESVLDDIDRKSFWMLARVLVQKRAGGKRQPASK
jgi:hypothetical protein